MRYVPPCLPELRWPRPGQREVSSSLRLRGEQWSGEDLGGQARDGGLERSGRQARAPGAQLMGTMATRRSGCDRPHFTGEKIKARGAELGFEAGVWAHMLLLVPLDLPPQPGGHRSGTARKTAARVRGPAGGRRLMARGSGLQAGRGALSGAGRCPGPHSSSF